MANNDNLFNAAVIGENGEQPGVSFIAEGKHLHAVEQPIAQMKKEQAKPELVLPFMRKALEALLQFAEGKVPHQFKDAVSLKPTEQEQLVDKIRQIYTHLPHHDRNELTSLIHHKQAPITKKR